MTSSPNRTDAAFRLFGYVAELQSFFQNHGVSIGSFPDLEAGARKFSEGGTVADELSAMIRSFVYREHEEVTESELTQLLLASLFGGSLDLNSAELIDPTRRIHDLLATALRSFRRSAPNAPYRSRLSKEPSRPEAAGSDPAQVPTTTTPQTGADSEERNQREVVLESPLIASTSEQPDLGSERAPHDGPSLLRSFIEPASLDNRNMASNQDAVAREVARMLAQDQLVRGTRPVGEPFPERPARIIEEVRLVGEREAAVSVLEAQNGHPALWPAVPSPSFESASEPVLRTRSVASAGESRDDRFAEATRHLSNEASQGARTRPPTPPETTKDADEVFPEYRTVPFPRPEHRTLWIVGLCCLLLGLAAGLLARGRHVTQDHPAVIHEAAPGPTSQLKPSPHRLRSPLSPPALAAVTSSQTFRTAPPSALLVPDLTQPYNGSASRGDTAASRVRVEGRTTAQAPTERYNSPPSEDLASELRAAASRSDSTSGTASSARPLAANVSSPAGSVYLSASGAMASNLMAAPAPAYPAQASAAGVQGRVVVQALVGRDGHVLDVHVMSGDRLLRNAALEAVTQWRYRPFVEDGRAAEVETVAILDFKLSR